MVATRRSLTLSVVSIASILCASCLIAAAAHAQEAETEAWEPITLGDTSGYIVPNAALEKLGLPPRTLPPEENAATYYMKAVNEQELRRDLRGRNLDEAFRQAIGDDPPDPIPEGLAAWLEEMKPVRDLIRQAAPIQRCQFPVISSQQGHVTMYAILLPYLAAMRQFSRVLVVEGRVHEQNGRPDRAIESYGLILRISAHAGQGDSLIGGLVGIACHSIGAKAIARLLATQDLDEATLAELQGNLDAIAPMLPGRARWIPMERAGAIQMVDVITRTPGALSYLGPEVPVAGNVAFPLFGTRAWRIVFPDRVLKQDFDRFYARMTETAQSPPWEAMAQWRSMRTETPFLEETHDWNVLAGLLLPALSRADDEYVKMQANHAALRINTALRRYKAAHGQYTAALDALAPAFLQRVPPDPFSGEPFHYRPADDGWTLWSVSYDLDDDGGQEGERYHRDDGDMVWRSAAKEEER